MAKPKTTRPTPEPKDVTQYDLRGIRNDIEALQRGLLAVDARLQALESQKRFERKA